MDKITLESIRAWAAENGLLPALGTARTSSREVSFSIALRFLSPFLEACPTAPPVAFSPQWQDEPDEQLKFVSVLVAAALWSLHAETEQRALSDASTAVAAGISDTAPTPQSSARHVESDAAQPPFPYPPRRAA